MRWEGWDARKARYTFSMVSSKAIRSGCCSVLGVFAPAATPPFPIHRFYQKPPAPNEALRRDFESVAQDFATVTMRELRRAEAQAAIGR